jgi:aspartate carbamoyltransferase catalytic subunit
MMRHIVRVADLSLIEVEQVLNFARESRLVNRQSDGGLVVALVFLAPSTRTRLGFTAAVARLGGCVLLLTELRRTGDGLPSESLADTVRVASGMSDVIVCRPGGVLEVADFVTVARCPLVNGGDAREHPTQALIDRFAIETFVGPPPELHIGVSGDLRTRSVRSLLQMFRLTPPRRLSLFAPPGRGPDASDLPVELAGVTVNHIAPDFSDLDVLLLPGLAPHRDEEPLAEDAHLKWGLSPMSVRSLPINAVVLSPGPVIDEIHPSCADDPRVRVFEQSDLGVPVRIGLVRWLLNQAV